MAGIFDSAHLHAWLHTVLWLGSWLLLVTVVFMPLELLFAAHKRPILSRSFLSDIGFYFISGLVPALIFTPILGIVAAVSYYYVPYSVHAAVNALPLWARVVAALLISELGFYWGHRWSHEIPFLWRFHAVHHKPEQIYFLVSARAHPFDNAFVRLCGLIPVVLLGIASPLSPSGGVISAVLVLAFTLWGFLIHANIKWRFGPLEWLIALPAFHHWHHTLGEPRDRNFASMLPLMDWLFGTYYLPKKFPDSYGTDTPMPASLPGQLLHPLLPQGAPRTETISATADR